MFKRILLGLGLTLVIIATSALAATELRWSRTFERDYPSIAARALVAMMTNVNPSPSRMRLNIFTTVSN